MHKNNILFSNNRKSLELRVLASLSITEAAEGIRSIALPVLVYASTGKLLYASLVAISGAVPAILIGIFGSPQVERLSRKKIIFLSNLVRFLLLVSLPLTWEKFGLFAIIFISFVSASLGALEKPALYSSLPNLFGEKYKEFVGKRAGVSFLLQSISPMIGGILVGILGAEFTLAICGLLYIIYGLNILSIKNFDSQHSDRAEQLRGKKNLHLVAEAFKTVKMIPEIRTLYVFWFLSMTAVPLGVLAAVPYIYDNLNLSSVEYGIVSAFYGFATVTSSFIAGKLNFKLGPRFWLLLSGIIYGTTNLVMIFEPGFAIFCLLWFIWGIAYGPEEVVGNVVFVKSAPEEMQGRLFSLMTVVMTSGLLVGNSLAGIISDALGPQYSMAIAGIIFIFATIFSFGFGEGAKRISKININD